MTARLVLGSGVREQLAHEAQCAWPHECCGLIVGEKTTLTLSLSKDDLRPMPNTATTLDRFEIDPAAHIALLRELRGTDREIIGCYHSHPNGKPEPSRHDLAGAAEEGFLWLIAALDSASAEPCFGAFVFTCSDFAPVEIEPR